MPGPGSLHQWVLRVAQAAAVATSTDRCGSDGTCGVPRIYEELVAEGERIGRKRVARLMRAAGLEGVSRRKRRRTTYRDRDGQVAAFLVNRDFTANGPDHLWVADITYISTWAGFLYLTFHCSFRSLQSFKLPLRLCIRNLCA